MTYHIHVSYDTVTYHEHYGTAISATKNRDHKNLFITFDSGTCGNSQKCCMALQNKQFMQKDHKMSSQDLTCLYTKKTKERDGIVTTNTLRQRTKENS